MSIFFRPTPNIDLQAMALTAFSGAPFVPAWYDIDAWLLQDGVLIQTGVSGLPLNPSGAVSGGFSTAGADASGNVYFSQHVDALVKYAASGGFLSYALPGGSGAAFNGLAFVSGYAEPYIVNSKADLYTVSGAAIAAVAPAPAFGSAPAFGLDASGTTLFTLLPAVSGLGTFALSSATSGTSGMIATPMAHPFCLAATSGAVAVGGWSVYTIGSGFAAMAPNAGATLLGTVTPASGLLGLWVPASGGGWSLNQSLSGLGGPDQVAWIPNGLGLLVSDPASGNVYVASYITTILALAQTIPLSGAGPIAIAPSSDYALVAQPSLNQITVFDNTTLWTSGAIIPLTGVASLFPLTATQMVAGYSGGVAFIDLGASGWVLGGTIALPFVPAAFAVDPNENLYAVGTSGALGYYAMMGDAALIATGSFSGIASGVAWIQGQLVIAGDETINVYQPNVTGVGFVPATAKSISAAMTAMAFALPYLLVSSASETFEFQFTSPYQLEPARLGLVSIYQGSGWTTQTLAAGQLPEAMAWDPSGNISVATFMNTLYTINPASGVLASGTGQIPQFSGQPQGTPIGLSRLLWLDDTLYGVTSLNDSLVEILGSGSSLQLMFSTSPFMMIPYFARGNLSLGSLDDLPASGVFPCGGLGPAPIETMRLGVLS
jgi:hypothetical protein